MQQEVGVVDDGRVGAGWWPWRGGRTEKCPEVEDSGTADVVSDAVDISEAALSRERGCAGLDGGLDLVRSSRRVCSEG